MHYFFLFSAIFIIGFYSTLNSDEFLGKFYMGMAYSVEKFIRYVVSLRYLNKCCKYVFISNGLEWCFFKLTLPYCVSPTAEKWIKKKLNHYNRFKIWWGIQIWAQKVLMYSQKNRKIQNFLGEMAFFFASCSNVKSSGLL